MPEVWAVVPAGGRGTRFSEEEDKLGVRLGGVPLLARTVQALLAAQNVHGVVVACVPERQEQYREWIGPTAKEVRFVPGGADRRASVFQGLLALPDAVEIVVVHDAARPLISSLLIDQAVEAVSFGAVGCVVALPIRDTVKQATPDALQIEATVDRSRLWRAQTPQVFRRELLLQAHRTILTDAAVTDDAQLMELAGMGPIVLLEGPPSNLKITTPEDRHLAEAWLALQGRAAPHSGRFYGA